MTFLLADGIDAETKTAVFRKEYATITRAPIHYREVGTSTSVVLDVFQVGRLLTAGVALLRGQSSVQWVMCRLAPWRWRVGASLLSVLCLLMLAHLALMPAQVDAATSASLSAETPALVLTLVSLQVDNLQGFFSHNKTSSLDGSIGLEVPAAVMGSWRFRRWSCSRWCLYRRPTATPCRRFSVSRRWMVSMLFYVVTLLFFCEFIQRANLMHWQDKANSVTTICRVNRLELGLELAVHSG